MPSEAKLDPKQQAVKAMQSLPDDATIEDALDRLLLLWKIERGLRQADAGNVVSKEEARRRMAKWLG